jgi:hypothetical protein
MNLPDNEPRQGETCTYFYVFVDRSTNANYSTSLGAADQRTESENSASNSLDSTVALAFERFADEFSHEAQVEINPKDYHSIRTAFGIGKLPAFGISDLDLTSQPSLPSNPPKLPSRWNLLRRGERKKILASEKFLPMVERTVVSRYPKVDDLYHFIRDLHFANIDRGLGGVSQKIEREIEAIGGEKVLGVVSIGKKIILG